MSSFFVIDTNNNGNAIPNAVATNTTSPPLPYPYALPVSSATGAVLLANYFPNTNINPQTVCLTTGSPAPSTGVNLTLDSSSNYYSHFYASTPFPPTAFIETTTAIINSTSVPVTLKSSSTVTMLPGGSFTIQPGQGYQMYLQWTTFLSATANISATISNTISSGGVLSFGTVAPGLTNTVGGTGAANTLAGIASTGARNTAFGSDALYALQDNLGSVDNTAVGFNAGYSGATGGYNVMVGSQALYSAASDGYNVAVGYYSLYAENAAGTGAGNVAVGALAGSNLTTGARNVVIGYNSQLKNTTDNNSIVIGAGATGFGGGSVALWSPSGALGFYTNAIATGFSGTGLTNLSFNTTTGAVIASGSKPVVSLPNSGTTNILPYQSGSLFNLVQALGNTTINLPAPFLGATYKFVVTATADGSHTQTIASTSNNCNGFLVAPAGATSMTNEPTKTNAILSSTAANVHIGDYIEYYCVDGAGYQFQAFSSGTASGWSFS